MRQLVRDVAGRSAPQLVIEQDDSLLEADRADLWAAVWAAGVTRTLSYAHLPPRSEPLSWIPDAVAWCWAHEGPWRDRIRPLLTGVVDV